MLNSLLQTSSYQKNMNSSVASAIAGAKPDLIARNQKSEDAVTATKSSVGDHITLTLNIESVNKAIDDKVTEYFTQYPNGGSDQDVAKFLESVRFAGL
jgi:hypothetical protein